jgi:predicted enzyme related to lactoylglutathione lyase
MDLLINVDVPDLARAITFYAAAFGLTVARRLGPDAAELSGWPVRL